MRMMVAWGLMLVSATLSWAEVPTKAEVVVYGATPGGIAAALAVGADGHSVVLIEPTARIGGLLTSGLSHTDFHAFQGLTGTFLNFSKRVQNYYEKKYGKDSKQFKACFQGTHGEPHVNLLILQQMLNEQKSVKIIYQSRIRNVSRSKSDGSPIVSARFSNAHGDEFSISAKLWIDGSYEGDLMALAGVPFKVGREGKDEFNERLAPEKADDELQGYNFRFIMTKDPNNRVTPKEPKGYKRDDFLDVIPLLKANKFKSVFGYPRGSIFKAHEPALPNNKHDINDMSGGPIRLSLPTKNNGWPQGTPQERQAIFDEHIRDQVGLLYFLQNDKDVPAKYQEEAKQWGWCKDEFQETGHLPPQLYVREARRMQGMYVYSQKDSQWVGRDSRAALHRDSIAMGEYGHNCHGTGHIGPRFGGYHTGKMFNATPPYQIPYGVMVPKDIPNLLVPVAVSSTHIGFCALRLEPIWTSLGQAAGHAAHLALSKKIPVQKVPVPELQKKLHQEGSATIYMEDVLPDHPDFIIVQRIGTAGGFHGLVKKGRNRGKYIISQYCQGYHNQNAELDKVLDESLAKKWNSIAKSLGIPADDLPPANGKTTRGDWLRAAGQKAQ